MPEREPGGNQAADAKSRGKPEADLSRGRRDFGTRVDQGVVRPQADFQDPPETDVGSASTGRVLLRERKQSHVYRARGGAPASLPAVPSVEPWSRRV